MPKVKPAWRPRPPARAASQRSVGESAQLHSFRRWWNSFLEPRGCTIHGDLIESVQLGVVPLQLLAALRREKLDVPHMPPHNVADQRENVRSFVRRLQHERLQLVGLDISGKRAAAELVEDLMAGKRAAVVTVTWSLILRYELLASEAHAQASVEAQAAHTVKELLSWVSEAIHGYHGVSVGGATRMAWVRNFADGRVFAAILHSHDARLLGARTWTQLEDARPDERLELIFRCALEWLGVPRLLDVATVLEGAADLRSVVTYTAKLRNAIRHDGVRRRAAAAAAEAAAQREAEEAESMLNVAAELAAWIAAARRSLRERLSALGEDTSARQLTLPTADARLIALHELACAKETKWRTLSQIQLAVTAPEAEAERAGGWAGSHALSRALAALKSEWAAMEAEEKRCVSRPAQAPVHCVLASHRTRSAQQRPRTRSPSRPMCPRCTPARTLLRTRPASPRRPRHAMAQCH